MNCRSVSIFASAFVFASALSAQEKTPAQKPAATPEKTKVLIFQPGDKSADPIRPGVGKEGVQKSAQPNPILDGPGEIVGTFFTAIKEGKIDEGYATLTKDSKIAEKPEELRQLKTKTREAIEVFGNIDGYDFVESRSIGQRLVRSTYVSHGKVFPLRWRFYFYKPETAWRLIDMRVDDKLTGIFDESEETKVVDPARP